MKRVTIAIIKDGEKILIAQRSQNDSYPGLFEFPGGGIEDSETAIECLERELMEELNIKVKNIQYYKTFEGSPDKPTHQFECYKSDYIPGIIILNEHTSYKWIPLSAINRDELPPIDKKILDDLLKDNPPK